jgi:hypothetical protein
MEIPLDSQRLAEENAALKRRILELEAKLERYEPQHSELFKSPNLPQLAPLDRSRRLNNDEIFRYGRQLILSEFGIDGTKNMNRNFFARKEA